MNLLNSSLSDGHPLESPVDRGRGVTEQVLAEEITDEVPPVETDVAWWRTFDDPRIDALVEAALAVHTDIAQGLTRIQEADALRMQALSRRLPTVNAQGSIGYSRNVTAFGTSEGTSVNGNLPINYEINLWGRFLRAHRAASDDVRAAQWDQEALRLALSARVVEGWFAYQASGQTLAIRIAQHEHNVRRLRLVETRVAAGLAARVDQLREQQTHAQGEMAVRLAQEDVALQAATLRRLVGDPEYAIPSVGVAFDPASPADRTEAGAEPLQSVRPLPPLALVTGAGAIAQRPDIRAARARITAADRRIGEAVAARLPSLQLQFNPGLTWQRNEVQGDFGGGMGGPTVASGFTLMTNATLNVPLFDGFQGRALVRANEARLQRAIDTLEGLVVQALVDLQRAQLQERRAGIELEALSAQRFLAEQTLAEAQARYEAGIDDLTVVLDAVATQQQTDLRVVSAYQQLLLARVATWQALGGHAGG